MRVACTRHNDAMMEAITPTPFGVTALRAHRFLLRAALSLGSVFAWILIFEYFYEFSGAIPSALTATALMYGLAQGVAFVVTPIAAMHLRRGAIQSLVWGAVTLAGAYTALGATIAGVFGTQPVGWGIACFAVLMGMYRAMYWIPYRLQHEELPHTRFPAHVVYDVVIALLPAFAGVTLATIDYPAERILFGAAALALCAIVPLFALQDVRETFSWDYVYTLKQLFRPKNHMLVGQSFLSGIEGASLFFIWPIAAFIVLEYSYASLGVVFSVSLLIILALRKAYRTYLHSVGLHEAPVLHTVVLLSGWVGRLAAGTPFGIIVADVFSYTGLPASRGVVNDPFVFEQTADRGAFLDEYTALKEMALAAGRICCTAIIGSLVLLMPLAYAFGITLVFAAVASAISYLAARHTAPSLI